MLQLPQQHLQHQLLGPLSCLGASSGPSLSDLKLSCLSSCPFASLSVGKVQRCAVRPYQSSEASSSQKAEKEEPGPRWSFHRGPTACHQSVAMLSSSAPRPGKSRPRNCWTWSGPQAKFRSSRQSSFPECPHHQQAESVPGPFEERPMRMGQQLEAHTAHPSPPPLTAAPFSLCLQPFPRPKRR